MKQLLLLVACLCMLSVTVFSQRTCAADDLLQQEIAQDPQRLQRLQEIENFTQKYLERADPLKDGATIVIPVVFNVVYNTNAENISDAQLYSQLNILNADFRLLNSDAATRWSDRADTQIEFCLATVDPNGNPTTGIRRRSTTATSFSSNNDMKRAALGITPWDAGSYLNFWVCDLSGGLLGYAQFPGGNAATDGVVVDYQYVGDIGTATVPFHLGRTATHEVGHWLNLRHIWGDGGCGVDDGVRDTPTSDGPNYGCAIGHVSCDSEDMVENYMDYGDDACLTIFTAGQRDRMQALWAPGGARASLLSSGGCGAGVVPTCNDGVQNGSETGVDCGGNCAPCYTCNDGIQNGNETGVDCGGYDCTPCVSCNDGIQNGSETGIDCGGSDCAPCVEEICEIPVGLYSQAIQGGRGARLSWSEIGAAAFYTVEIRLQGAAVWIPSYTSRSSFTVGRLIPGFTYEWRVTANCSAEALTSEVASFVAGSSGRYGSAAGLVAFPNPTKATLYLDVTGLEWPADGAALMMGDTYAAELLTVSLLDVTGREVLRRTLSSETAILELPVHHLPAGLYVARVSTSTGAMAGQVRIVIE